MFISNVHNLSRGSHAKVQIECSSKVSEKCKGIVERAYRDAMTTIENNNGSYICLQCSRALKSSGSNNPNCKYQIDHNMFTHIDTANKAYLLGWIASDGHINKHNWSISIQIHKKDIDCLIKLKDIICDTLPISTRKDNMITLEFHSKQISKQFCQVNQIVAMLGMI